MSLYKRIFLDNDPAYEAERQKAGAAIEKRIKEFPFRLPGNRRNRSPGGGHWDPCWPNSIATAIKELGIQSINVNGGVCFRSQGDADAVKRRADEIWSLRIKELQALALK